MTVNTLAMDLRTTRLQVGKRGSSGHRAGPAHGSNPGYRNRECSGPLTLCHTTANSGSARFISARHLRADTRSGPQASGDVLPCHAGFLILFFLQHTTTTACESSSRTRRTRGLGGSCPAPLAPTHILDSLEAAPPVTLATRSCDSSTFRSSSCFSSSSFFFPRRSRALILACRRRTGRQYPRPTPGPASRPPSAPTAPTCGPRAQCNTGGLPGFPVPVGQGGIPGLPFPRDAGGHRVPFPRDAGGSRVPFPRDAGGFPAELSHHGGRLADGAKGAEAAQEQAGTAAGPYQRAMGREGRSLLAEIGRAHV